MPWMDTAYLQIIDKKDKLEDYKNGFVNLALPFFGFSEPIAAAKQKYNDTEWTLWDRFELRGNPTLQEFIDYFQNEHKLEVQMVSQGVSMLWSGFIPPKKQAERAGMKMSELVENVSKKPIPAHVKNLLVEIMVANEEDEDVEVRLKPGNRVKNADNRSHMFWFISRYWKEDKRCISV